MEKTLKGSKGITLIALVITIIVLLILASVSIAMLTGNNGILTQAQNAKNETKDAENIEKIKLAVSEAQMGENGYQKLSKDNLQEAIDNQFKETNPEVAQNADGTYIVSLDNELYEIKDNEVDKIQVDLYINNAEDLKKFRDEVNKGNTYEGEYIVLTANITLDINEEWQPIGTYLNTNTSINDETNIAFEGTLNGMGHTIDGIKITSQEKGKGLFGLIKNATIKNLTIGENCNINVGVSYGSITGYANTSSTIEGCFNKTNVISNSTNIGGIVGTAVDNCMIKNSGNLGNIQANSTVGGIVGVNQAQVENCYNIGEIKSEITNAGGIIGVNNGIVTNCYNTGNITGTGANIGGIIGMGTGESRVENTYSKGNITGSDGGGIVGFLESGTIINSYYLENSVNGNNGNNIFEGTTAISDNQLKIIYTSLGSTFKEDSNKINNGYPILSWQ